MLCTNIFEMHSIKEHYNSILCIDENNSKIIEHNLLTKSKFVHHHLLNADMSNANYFIVGDDQIISVNIDTRTIVWRDDRIIIDIDKDDCLFACTCLFQVKNEVMIGVLGNDALYVYDLNGVYYREVLPPDYGVPYDISLNGRYIAFYYGGSLYRSRIHDLDRIFSIQNKNGIKIDIDGNCNVSMLNENPRIVVIECYDKFVIVNMKTCAKIDIPIRENLRFFAVGRCLVISSSTNISIYDSKRFNVLATIHCNLCFVAYNVRLQILITNKLDYYRINNKFELCRVILGQNYLRDTVVAQNDVMDTILSCDLLCELPMEILCTELYSQILLSTKN